MLAGTIVWSNLGLPNSYSPGIIAAWSVDGPSSPDGFTASAMAFTSPDNFRLDQIDVALSYNDFGSNSLDLTLHSDSGGLPGAALMTWALTNLPTYGTCCILQTVTPNSPLVLSAAAQYWLVATAGDGTVAVWDINSTGQIGPLTQTFTPDSYSGVNVSSEGAFDVQGTIVPEPTTFALFAGSLLLLGSRMVTLLKPSTSGYVKARCGRAFRIRKHSSQ